MAPEFTRRKLDLEATLTAYTNRLLSFRPETFEQLSGCWLSSYDIWDSYTREQLIENELDLRRFTKLDNNVLVLFHVCVGLGINVLGITSDRLVKGNYIAAITLAGGRESATVFYVGEHNAFATKKRHPQLSLLTEDKRYVCKKMFNNSKTKDTQHPNLRSKLQRRELVSPRVNFYVSFQNTSASSKRHRMYVGLI